MPAARALGLLVGGAALGLLVNGVRPGGVRLASYAPPTVCAATTPTAPRTPGVPAVETLSPVDASALCGDPRTLIADVRPAESFAQGHVSGAIHLPCTASGVAASAAVELVAGRQSLIVYGDTTDDARRVAEEMRRRIGKSDLRVVVLEGGFSAWSQAGLACASGACAQCQDRPPGHASSPGQP
ncbi:MAG TPA: rhodanese-like domain-containing protein [Polyangia bacterium]